MLLKKRKKVVIVFFMITPDGKRHIALWPKVIEWLNDKLEDAEDGNDKT